MLIGKFGDITRNPRDISFKNSSTWTPKDLFAYGNEGFWPGGFDVTSGRGYQDLAPNPLNAPNLPTGLYLDQSKGLERGPNIAKTLEVSDFVIIGGQVVITDLGDRLRFTRTSVAGSIIQSYVDFTPEVTAQWYYLQFNIVGIGPNNNAYNTITNGGGTIIFGAGYTHTPSLKMAINRAAPAGTRRMRLNVIVSRGTNPESSVEGDWVEISKTVVCQTVPGEHVAQTVAVARPTTTREPKGGRRNLLLDTDLPNVTPWSHGGGTLVDGTFTFISSPSSRFFQRIYGGFSAGESVTASFDVRSTSGATSQSVIMNGGGQAGNNKVWGIVPVTSEFNRVSVTTTIVATDQSIYLIIGGGTGADAVGGSFEFRNIQVERGEVPTPYQKVTTIYDVTETGVPDVWSLRTDGVDDFMQSAAMFDVNKPWYFAVCAMIESDGGITSSQTPFFGLNAPGGVIRNMIGVRSAGGIRVCAVHRNGAANPVSVTDVITGVSFGQPFIVEGWADGTNLHCSLNGGTKVSAPYTPGSSPNLAPIQLAAGNGIAPTRYYDALAVQRIPSDAERAALRARWAARYLP